MAAINFPADSDGIDDPPVETRALQNDDEFTSNGKTWQYKSGIPAWVPKPVPMATEGEMEEGTEEAARWMSPLRVAQAIEARLAVVIVAEPLADYEVTPPVGPSAADSIARYFVTTTDGGQLTLAAGIVVPDGYSTFPYTMVAGKTFIVQLIHTGSFWIVSSFVGPYTAP